MTPSRGLLEIRDAIHGPIPVSTEELIIVDSPYVQRLRGIKQTGFAELTFPGATHNRYCHSLGAFHLAGRAFDHIFEGFDWKDSEERQRVRHLVRLAALLHDCGHGPLSHAIEQAMPAKAAVLGHGDGQASHEDYTEAILLRSSLSPLLNETFGPKTDLAVTSIIRNENRVPEAFLSKGRGLFPLLSSLVSSEIDVDRMDYMPRDSLYCGIPYGNFDHHWIFSHLTFLEKDRQLFLALDSRALYAFEDFLLSRYHMYLMVYLHHKAIIYDEMLFQFLKSAESEARLPSSIDEYLHVDDYWLREKLRSSKSPWAQRIIQHRPFKMLLELNSDQTDEAKSHADELESKLKRARINYFRSSSTGLLSKYSSLDACKTTPLFVVYRDPRFTSSNRPGITYESIYEATQLFTRYHRKRIIDRIFAETNL